VYQNDYQYWQDAFIGAQIGNRAFFESIMNPDSETASGAGSCTTSFVTHASIKQALEDFNPLAAEGGAFRENALGLVCTPTTTFPSYPGTDYKGIGLGVPNKVHDMIRPLLDELMGDGTVMGDSAATEGKTWTYEGLLESAKTYIGDKDAELC
jgi:hypothetical protein